MARRFRIDGLRALDQALGELPRATGRNVLKRVGLRRMRPVETAARDNTENFVRTGDLQASHSTTDRKPRRHRRQSTVEVFVEAGPEPQAVQQEFGNRHHGPQPFMRPAWDQERDGVLDGVKDDLAQEIDQAAARAARKQARLIRQAGG